MLEAATDQRLNLERAHRIQSSYFMAEQPVLLVLGRVRPLQLIFLQTLIRHAVKPNLDVDFTRGDPAKAAVYQTDFVIEDWEAKSRKLNAVEVDPFKDSNKVSSQCSVKVVVAPSLDSLKVSSEPAICCRVPERNKLVARNPEELTTGNRWMTISKR